MRLDHFPEALLPLSAAAIGALEPICVVSSVLDGRQMSDIPPSDSIRKKESIYVLSPLDESSSQDGREILIADLLVGIWRRRWIIAAVAFLGGLAGFGLAQTTPRRFEATATLLIQPPQFSSELQPAALPVHAYQALVNTDYTLAQVRDALVEDGVLPKGSDLRQLRGMVSTTIPQTKRARYEQSLPMIEISVAANTPEQAEGIANTYARVFVQMSREVTTRGQEGALQLIESQYPTARKRLRSAVLEKKERLDHYARAQAALTRSWNTRVSDFNSATEELVRVYGTETQRLTLEFLNTYEPSLLQARQKVKEERLIQLEEDLEEIRIGIKSAQYAVAGLEQAIESQPQTISLAQSLPSQAWFSKVTPEEALKLSRELNDMGLKWEMPNTIHTMIMEKLVAARVAVETLTPKENDLKVELGRAGEQVEELNAEQMTIQLDRSYLTGQRQAGLAKLKKGRATQLAVLTSHKSIATGDLARNQELELSSLALETGTAETTFELIAQKYESAQLAKSGQEPDVKVGALALRPEFPVGKNTLTKTAIGLLAAFLLAFFAVAVVEALSTPGVKGEYGVATGSQLAGEGARNRRLVESKG